MFGKVLSSAVLGIDAYTVEVEAHLENTTPAKFFTVGLAEGAVKESKERVLAAMKNSGFRIPSKRITVNLAPADIRKEGAAFDLPIAVAILCGLRHVDTNFLDKIILIGELSLDGELRPVKGILPICINAKKQGINGIIVPPENQKEASFVPGLKIAPVSTLKEVVEILNGEKEIQVVKNQNPFSHEYKKPEPSKLIDLRGNKFIPMPAWKKQIFATIVKLIKRESP
jgi:magnesium chelatase family protein